MRLVLHPKVHSDVLKIMEDYERVATSELADDFYRELRHFMREAAERPESFSIRERELASLSLPFSFSHRGRRRANFGRPPPR